MHILLLTCLCAADLSTENRDGIPIFHQRFYQAVAISIPLIVLRLPPVRRWVIEMRQAGRAALMWLTISPLLVLYFLGFGFIINEEFFTGLKVITMTHLPSD
ncbi:MAG TPA: hypothetical protein VLW50_00530 [Streptosporangiaceae bacterium]|nr:hypothetical protein [Streptosporangiaceae bacterium]